MALSPQQMGVALLLRKFGTKVEDGGYEVQISNADIMAMSSLAFAQIQETRDPVGNKVVLRLYPNVTIEGEEPDPEPVQPAIADGKTPA